MNNKKLTLKTLVQADLPLIERWLYLDHVRKWFERPESKLFITDWLYEIRHQDDEYKWINYYLVLVDNNPIGFALYYDCFDAKEDWYQVFNEKEMFSIDYFIGEEAFLGKGYGKTLIDELIQTIKKSKTARMIVVQPHPENYSSSGVLLANGFSFDSKQKYYFLKLK